MNNYSYKESLREKMIETVESLFDIKNPTNIIVDRLLEDGILDLKSEILKKNDGIYRKCVCINKKTNKQTEFILKLN